MAGLADILAGGQSLTPQQGLTWGIDPDLASLAFKQKIAAGLIGQAGDTSPTLSPLAAISRAIAPVIGGISARQNQQQLTGWGQGASEELASIANSPNPLTAASQSTNPLIRAMVPQLATRQLGSAADINKILAEKGYRLNADGTTSPIAVSSGGSLPSTDLGKLIAARDALPQGDPRRSLFDAQITKANSEGGFTFGASAAGTPGSATSIAAPVSSVQGTTATKAQGGPLDSWFNSLEDQNGLPRGLLRATAGVESGLGANQGPSSAGATGIFQFMPDTAKAYKVQPGNIESEAPAAAKLLGDLVRKNGGDINAALAAYGGFKTKDPSGYIAQIMQRMPGAAPHSDSGGAPTGEPAASVVHPSGGLVMPDGSSAPSARPISGGPADPAYLAQKSAAQERGKIIGGVETITVPIRGADGVVRDTPMLKTDFEALQQMSPGARQSVGLAADGQGAYSAPGLRGATPALSIGGGASAEPAAPQPGAPLIGRPVSAPETRPITVRMPDGSVKTFDANLQGDQLRAAFSQGGRDISQVTPQEQGYNAAGTKIREEAGSIQPEISRQKQTLELAKTVMNDPALATGKWQELSLPARSFVSSVLPGVDPSKVNSQQALENITSRLMFQESPTLNIKTIRQGMLPFMEQVQGSVGSNPGALRAAMLIGNYVSDKELSRIQTVTGSPDPVKAQNDWVAQNQTPPPEFAAAVRDTLHPTHLEVPKFGNVHDFMNNFYLPYRDYLTPQQLRAAQSVVQGFANGTNLTGTTIPIK